MLLYLFTVVINILIYLYGFFPINQNSGSIIEPPDSVMGTSLNSKEIYVPHLSRIVFIVIDALRNDFVQNDTMPFTTNKARTEGCMIGVEVECPTVTLPRIKSLTTGTVPQFIDIVFNFGDGNSHELKDSLLHVLRRAGKNIVFYGDDTWLRLFPHVFDRFEGTSSFFVNDFYEVDNNVTRNLQMELEKNDWDIMILHYLGLDHIGHVYGPTSPLIPKKLKEMDDIIKLIHTKTADSRTLILITGDHGMKDSGGHGGASFSETNVPLALIGLPCEDDSISQTDIPANLAALLGVEIPGASVGLMRSSILKKFSHEQYLYALRYNAISLLSKRNMCTDHYDLATKYHALYVRNKDTIIAEKVIKLYENCSKMIQESILKTSTKQDVKITTVALINLCYLFLDAEMIFADKQTIDYSLLFLLIINVLYFISGSFVGFLILMSFVGLPRIIFVCFYHLFRKFYATWQLEYFFLVVMTALHPFTLISSSFIEEEHQYWYYILTSLMYLCLIRKLNSKRKIMSSWLCLIILVRFLRTINQTGDKWSSSPDLADWFLKYDNMLYLSLYFIICLISVVVITSLLIGRSRLLALFINSFIFTLILSKYFLEGEKVLIERCIWFLIFIQIVLCCFHRSKPEVVWISICALILKPYNLGLITLCVIASRLFEKYEMGYEKTEFSTLCHIWLGKALFFMQGHSNSLASVDISSGYVAVSFYQPVIVFLQVLCHTYAMPVLSLLLLMRNKFIKLEDAWLILFLYQVMTLIVFFITALIHRHHIFIWSVFAPKLFVESMNTLVLFIELFVYRLIQFRM